MSHHTTAVVLRCMDKRHWGKLAQALDAHTGGQYAVYDVSVPGGAGMLADLGRDPHSGIIKEFIGITVEHLGATEIWLAVHGTHAAGDNGCGAYKLAGHGEHYASPDTSKQFSTTQLKKAAESAKLAFPGIHNVRVFYITFAPDGENIVHDVL